MLMQDYKFARSLLSFIAGIGWFSVFIGGAFAMIAMVTSDSPAVFYIYGGSAVVGGLGLVLVAQLASAQIDTAESTKKLVEIMSNGRPVDIEMTK